MKTQSLLRWVAGLGLAGASIFVPAAQAARTAFPGTVNYVEGEVTLNGSRIGTNQSGNIAMQPDQVLTTGQGKAEVLLSPGAYLRVGNNSEIRMVAANLSDPRVEVVKGEAVVEVDYKPKMAGLDVMERGGDTALLKEGLYRFDADEGQVAVIDGKAAVMDNGHSKDIGRGKEITLTGATLKQVSFDRKAEDDLYRWSDVRASYLAEANQSAAQTVYLDGGWGAGFYPGWFWNPWFSTWAWLPYDGYFYSPFGYPFYSPGFVVYARGFYGGPRFYGGARTFVPRSSGFVGGFARSGGFAHGGLGRR